MAGNVFIWRIGIVITPILALLTLLLFFAELTTTSERLLDFSLRL